MESGDSTRVIVFDGNRQELDKKTNKLSILYFDQYTIELENTTDKAAVRYREPRERTLTELLEIAVDNARQVAI